MQTQTFKHYTQTYVTCKYQYTKISCLHALHINTITFKHQHVKIAYTLTQATTDTPIYKNSIHHIQARVCLCSHQRNYVLFLL